MKIAIVRETALEALKKCNKEPLHILRALTMEGAMRWFAQDQGCGEEEDFWGIAGLLHDIDFKMYPEQHCVKTPEPLKKAGAEDELIHTVCSHGYDLVTDVKPEHQMEKILFASDEFTGLIGAMVRMRPSGSVMDIEVSSLKEKFKDKRFVAGCPRDVIREGVKGLGQTLEELMGKTIRAMQSCEATVGEEMKAYET